jgi:type VI secretion system protein ImpE
LRKDPGDAKRRTFLFELLCFAGAFERAEKQLDILAQNSKEADMGALVYRAALHAERTRQELFEKKDYPSTVAAGSVTGMLNDKPFLDLVDGDPRIGARLEVFAAGSYLWISFEHIASVEIPPPRRLRDLIWTPALLRTGPSFKGTELGEVLIPVLTPSAWRNPDDAVRLGRVTQWRELEDGATIPEGQKMLLVDGEDMPILEVRRLEISAVQSATT